MTGPEHVSITRLASAAPEASAGSGLELKTLEFEPGQVRGSHWHRRKHEVLIVLRGTLEAEFLMPDQPDDISRVTLEQGAVVELKPGCAHSFRAPVGALAIELSPQGFDEDDVVRVRHLFPWADD